MDIKGQVAIISGGGSGMGAQTAQMLALQGAKVALLDINEAAVIAQADKVDGIPVVCDVSDSASVTAAFAHITDQLGTPTICINCAGIAPAKRIVGRAGAMPLEAFSQTIEVNLVGTFNVMRVAAHGMSLLADPINESGERGVIINTASIAAYEGQIGQAAYSASKGGIVAMTLPAARELSQFGIRVVTIAPGIVATPMMASLPEAVQQSLAAQIPFPKRMVEAAEYAKLVSHIIDNQMLNGTVIRLDGAIRMQPQ